ncbi:hypothetical protein [uncultured Piscinibacter sp.]|uniref:hypothetical protein n=1 Tax=uncultured Piscinibacter sp. TaxID=1131835 RepID=UPI002629D404|nr:hypothetical protein [uncultured Piscinibacter sp.]
MNAARFAYAAVVTAALIAAASQSQAQTFGTHPALGGTSPAAAGIDPNHFIVGHPAGLVQRAGHANQVHPADAVSAQGAPAVDANHFLVQPPSSVRWAPAPAESLSVAAAR